ncbi:MAG TPA: alpha/beta hydrolase [Ktedonosporobacter sp.]|nr:alpha/beta hydrolase [Ktedonosporobacter sp.]
MEDLTVTHRQITRGTSTLHYWLAGPEDSSLVVFTHGGLLDHRMFEAQLASIAREYRMLLWDVHGHGQSQPLGMGGVFSLRTVVDDLLAIIDQQGYRQACFVGQSFGTFITQELAFLYPERVTAMVIIGGYCITMKAPQSLPRLQQGDGANRAPAEFKQAIANMVGIRPEVKAYALEACAPEETWRAMNKAVPDFFHEEAGYHIPMPFLLTHGDQDALKGIGEQAQTWAQRDPHCQYVVIPDAGHNANQDNAKFFNQVLIGFLHRHVPLTIKR